MDPKWEDMYRWWNPKDETDFPQKNLQNPQLITKSNESKWISNKETYTPYTDPKSIETKFELESLQYALEYLKQIPELIEKWIITKEKAENLKSKIPQEAVVEVKSYIYIHEAIPNQLEKWYIKKEDVVRLKSIDSRSAYEWLNTNQIIKDNIISLKKSWKLTEEEALKSLQMDPYEVRELIRDKFH